MRNSSERWGLLWHSVNKREGVTEHLLFVNCLPLLFVTRKDARVYAEREYAWIKTRPDLRQEPHGWRMPRPVRVVVTVKQRH